MMEKILITKPEYVESPHVAAILEILQQQNEIIKLLSISHTYIPLEAEEAE